MSYLFELLGAWLYAFFPFFLLRVLPFWFGAWLITLLVLLFSFKALKPRLRSRVLKFDEAMNQWARALRYKLRRADAALEPNTPPSERVLLTWFFRFWTNFASAPSLSVIAFLVPLWFYHRSWNSTEQGAEQYVDSSGYLNSYFDSTRHWLLPAFCYFGSMGLSYILKRVFKRLRPVRHKGAFGHGLQAGSFPSGHSLTAFCFWMAMIASVSHQSQSLIATIAFAVIAILIVALTGLSRIYMAVHWPSDVAGGYVIGLVWTIVFLLTCSHLF